MSRINIYYCVEDRKDFPKDRHLFPQWLELPIYRKSPWSQRCLGHWSLAKNVVYVSVIGRPCFVIVTLPGHLYYFYPSYLALLDIVYIEDVHSFAVNTINIVIECNENICSFTSAKHEWKFECFHYTRWKLWYSLKKSKFSFYFIVYTTMRASDVITNVIKQNMNVMASM